MRKAVYIFIGILLFFVLFSIFSCPTKHIPSVLAKAESLVFTNPDSALLLLRNLCSHDDEISVKAKYALLLTQAKDKKSILHTDDSLIKIAVSYYDSIGNIAQSAQAHYYLGRVYQDMLNETGAVSEYLTALPLAEQNGEEWLLCLLYGNLGQIYFQQDLLDRADSLFILSESIAIQKNDSFNLAMGLIARGNVCLQKKEYSCAMSFFERSLVIAKDMRNINAEKIVLNCIAALYASIGLPEKTIEYSRRGLKCKMNVLSTARLNLLEGSAFIELEKYDSARCCVFKSLNTSDLPTKMTAYLLLVDIEEKQGNLDDALYFHNCYIECSDSLNMIESRTRNIISNGNKSLYLERFQKLLNSYQFYICSLLSLIFLLVIYWVNTKHQYCSKISTLKINKRLLEERLIELSVLQDDLRKKEQELKLLKDFASMVEEDKAKLYNLTNQVNLLKNQSQDFFLKLLMNAKSYNTLMLLIKQKKENPKSRASFSKKEWNSLLKDVNFYSNGFVEKLKSRETLLSDNDICFCCLFKIGINYPDMAIVFDRTLDAMYKKRNAILLNKLVDMSNIRSMEDLMASIL